MTSLSRTDFWAGATFLPVDRPSRTIRLLDFLFHFRQATLVALSAKLEHQDPRLSLDTNFEASIERFRKLPELTRRQFLEAPAVRCWLKATTRLVAQVGAKKIEGKSIHDHLLELDRLLDAEGAGAALPNNTRIPHTLINVARYEVDPLIRQFVPPSYVFPPERVGRERDLESIYTLSFFRDVARAALDRIEECWPEAYGDILHYVRLIVHLRDGDFRSCSADRYAGVILLTASDASLIEVEESIVHEYGHQILYCLMELDHIVINDQSPVYRLPWSGSERDYYGYFHAFYIYTLLAMYYARLACTRPHHELEFGRARFLSIMDGLRQAAPELAAAGRLTPCGQELLDGLRREIDALKPLL